MFECDHSLDRAAEPLFVAIADKASHGKIRSWLDENGGSRLDSLCDQHGNRLLTAAASRGDAAMVATFLTLGASPDVQNLKGLTPLMTAASFSRLAVVKLLHKAGARLDLKLAESDGLDALGIAEAKGADAVAAYLRNAVSAALPVEHHAETGSLGWSFAAMATLAIAAAGYLLLQLMQPSSPVQRARAAVAIGRGTVSSPPHRKGMVGTRASPKSGAPHRTPNSRREQPSKEPRPSQGSLRTDTAVDCRSDNAAALSLDADGGAVECGEWSVARRGGKATFASRSCPEPRTSWTAEARADPIAEAPVLAATAMLPAASCEVTVTTGSPDASPRTPEHAIPALNVAPAPPCAPPALMTPEDTMMDASSNASSAVIHLAVSGIACTGCKLKVQHALQAQPAVSRVSIDFEHGLCRVVGAAALLDTRELCAAVRRLGVECVPAALGTPATLAGSPAAGSPRDLLRRLLILKQLPLEQKVVRFRCGCGCDGCICSGERLLRGDPGRPVSIGDLCQKIEAQVAALGGPDRKQIMTGSRSERHTRTPSSDIRALLSLEEVLEDLVLPCPCGKEQLSPPTAPTSSTDWDSRAVRVEAPSPSPGTPHVSPGGTSSYA